MERDPDSPVVYRDLVDLREEIFDKFATKEYLHDELEKMRTSMTKELFAEMSRIAKVIMEHTTRTFSVLDDKLNAHIENTLVHKRPRRGA